MKELKELQAEAISQNEPETEAEAELRSQRPQLKVDPTYAGTLDKLLAEPSVRAVLDAPEMRKGLPETCKAA